MSTIVTRSGKGSPLTHNEVDANFNNLNTDKVEKTAADITGGTINNTSIGATTPSTVNATTITGQTGQLNGTGSNLVIQSQSIGTSTWVQVGTATASINSAVAPDSTNTASTITNATDITFGGNNLRQTITVIGNSTYTLSCYIRFGTATTVSVTARDSGTGGLSTVTTTTATNWTRVSVTVPTSASATSVAILLGAANGTFFAWGAQLEIGSVANTYIPTTTTAVYGTPTLSFSGVSSIGLLSNGALYLQPAGTGALQAQATTSTTAGGNARGANAVDWQTLRNSADHVASGTTSVVSGGNYNRATQQNSVVAGGAFNNATGYNATVSGGQANTASQRYAGVVSGYANSATGYHNFIGTGYANSGTANAAVTTQSGTMNGTTAVTLSGSNASIKVGQLITGTSITSFPDTYVAAISGTSLTLSQAASGSSTSTLSFFTPHGVVVGGGNNQATGSYSFIGGGGDAGTAANRNVASGDWSFVGGGRGNQATGAGSVVAGGGWDGTTFTGNTSSGLASAVLTGLANTASGSYSVVLGGNANTATGNNSSVLSGAYGTSRGLVGNTTFAASNSPVAVLVGASQSSLLVLGKQTTDATPTALCSNGNAAGTTNQVILPNNSAYFFRGEVVSGKTAAGDTKGWTIEGVIKRGANAASTALVGIPTVTSTYADLGAATWDIAVTADTTNGGIRVTFTGQAATTIRTVCQIRTTEMTF
jgi:hypothetical protein